MKNKYEVRGDTTAIFIFSKGIKYECLIDTEDIDKFLMLDSSIYLRTMSKNRKTSHMAAYYRLAGRKNVYVHRMIMDAPKHLQVDHINRNPLDNRKVNLRLATNSENQQNITLKCNNSCGHKGIYYKQKINKWVVQIAIEGKKIHIGCFQNITQAVLARDASIKKYHPYAQDSAIQHELIQIRSNTA